MFWKNPAHVMNPNAQNPTRHLGQAPKRRLEEEIDRHSLEGVLVALEEIAMQKAEHIRDTWQDEGLARAWERTAKAIEKASTKARNEGV